MNCSCDIHWFAERDIDVWLAEELRVNAHFARWFLERIGAPDSILTPAYRTGVSICEGRETDVEALFQAADGSTFAVLIEDKIKAGFQPDQMEDYLQRAKHGKNLGKWDSFAVVVFAPSYRTFDIPDDVVRVNFENAAEHFAQQGLSDARANYRAEFLQRAATPQTIVASGVDEFVRQWWQAVNGMLEANFGGFFRPQEPRKTTYVVARFLEQPSYVRLDLKGNQGEVALAFLGFPEEQLRSLVGDNKPDEIELIKKSNWKDPVLLIRNLEKFEVSDGLEIIADRVRTAYEAAYKLANYLRENRSKFDSASAKYS